MDAVHERGFSPETCAMDKGYDSRAIHDGCEAVGCRPIIAQIRQQKARTHDDVPTCEDGRWTFAGADFKRTATKWRCPPGACQPKSALLKADRRNPTHPARDEAVGRPLPCSRPTAGTTLIPRETKRWGDLYRGRGAVERELGRLKHEYGLTPLRVRGLAKVALHADLTMLARLSLALNRARAVPLAA